VFRAMLRQNFAETQSNKMKVAEFEPETVESFLDYVYADYEMIANHEDVFLRTFDDYELIPLKNVYEKKFDRKRLTPDLLRFCHMYEVKSLQDRCVHHLRKTINDDSVVDIWSAAEMIGSDWGLNKVALEYLVKRGDKMSDVPGLKESFQSPQLVESLFNHMSAQITLPPQCHEVVTICARSRKVRRTIQVNRCATVKVLRLLIDEELAAPSNSTDEALPNHKCRMRSIRLYGSMLCLEEDKTLAHYMIDDKWTVDFDIYLYK